MKQTRFFQLIILILLATVCLSACITQETPLPDDSTPVNAILPFDNDGIFIFTPAYLEEYHNVNFRYAEGRRNFDEWNGTFYTAVNFHLYAADFVCIMNSLKPVLMDTISTNISGFHDPFEGFTHENYLYRLHISDFDLYNFHMRVHKTEDFGYLHFSIFEWESVGPQHSIIRDDLRHFSLYRITLDELEQIIEFAEGLEKGEV